MRNVILVTGGAGFIGSNIVAAMEQQGFRVVVCDRLRDQQKWRNLANRKLADFIFPDDLPDFLNIAGDDIAAIIHMGAISATTATDADQVMANNFKLSVELWRWCAANAVRFIYASSAATYGAGENGFVDQYDADSLAQLRPLNLYGWSKHVFDRWVVEEIRQSSTLPPQWVGLKFFNVYGPNEYHKGSMRSVISQLFDTISAGTSPRLFKSYRDDYSDGGQLRDFIYVKDCVKSINWLLNNPTVSGIFNVGTGQARSFADLATATMQAMAVNLPIEFIEMPEAIRGKYQYYTEANMTNLRQAGYTEAFYTLEEGVYDYVSNYLSQSSQHL